MKEPEIHVGIVSAAEIHFTLNAPFAAEGRTVCGRQQATFEKGHIRWNGNLYRELTFTPAREDASFSLQNVTIGIDFHWEQQETQTFTGTLRLITAEGKVTAVNQLAVEDYLVSVISSEMNANSPAEFLKAHAVISRSWVLAQINKREHLDKQSDRPSSSFETETEHIRWYDREDHSTFDVCADDHCQRYQGITKASSPTVAEAVRATCGQVLMYGQDICDARFSKCCGGISEEFRYCWEDKDYPYLHAVRDNKGQNELPDLTNEQETERWICQTPEAFCNTNDPQILSLVLNHYDRRTTDFFRWKVKYTQKELSELVRRKMNADYGKIVRLIPMERGRSGRISKLKIIGTQKSCIIGKELEIRKALSETHLLSSAFTVSYGQDKDGAPEWLELTGAGWGHGVGLCQIGAAVMGKQGYGYRDILLHYYKGASIRKVY